MTRHLSLFIQRRSGQAWVSKSSSSCIVCRDISNNSDRIKEAARVQSKDCSMVVCGDSQHRENYMKLGLDKRPATILITDPPYCLLERKKATGELRDPKARPLKTDGREEVPRFSSLAAYRLFTKLWLESCLPFLSPQTELVIWTNYLGKKVIIDECARLHYHVVGEFVWAKVTAQQTKQQSFTSTDWRDHSVLGHATTSEVMLRAYESALIFSLDNSLLGVQAAPSGYITVRGKTVRRASLPWVVATGYRSPQDDSSGTAPSFDHHPCHKPLAVLEPLLATWTRSNDVVLDPFAGSGGVAAALLSLQGGRIYKGIEILPYWHRYTQSIIESVRS